MDAPLIVEQVAAETAASRLREGEALLVDVREPEEWHAGRAPEAVHVPLGELGNRLGELPADRDLIIVCRSGARSDRAATALASLGFRASNLAGGMRAWHAASLPVVTDAGAAGTVI